MGILVTGLNGLIEVTPREIVAELIEGRRLVS